MVKARKVLPTLDELFFSSPAQRVIRFLLSEATSSFTLRVLISKLKGVRGLGGLEGLQDILEEYEAAGLVEFLDNRRSVRLREEHFAVESFKVVSALCDLESLRVLLEPLSKLGILFGSRATGKARSDSDYDVFVVTSQADEVVRVAGGHPLGKQIQIVCFTPENYERINEVDPGLVKKLENGIQLWESARW